jgi:hypothetical protein
MQEYKVQSFAPLDWDGYVSSPFGKWYYLVSSRLWIYLWFSINLINVLWSDLHSSRKANSDLQDGASIDRFLRQSFLYWLEALSLMRNLPIGIVMIGKLENRLQVRFFYIIYILFENLN